MASKGTRAGKSAGGGVRVGISGWTYAPWRGTFYPEGLPQKKELEYAGATFSSIEINGTFFGLRRPKDFAAWYDQTPDGFVFAVKAPRFITHILRLRNAQTPIANFFLSGPLRLNEKLGPFLWQFPPNFQFDPSTFEPFLAQLPRTTTEMAALRKQTDDRMKGRLWAETDRDRPVRHAVEIRHESFASPGFVELLRKHNVALVTADTAGKWPMLFDVTADFVYARLHGAEELYASGYTDAALDEWAARIRAWSAGRNVARGKRIGPPAAKRPGGRDVYAYFDNDVKVRSPFDAARLAVKLGLRDKPLEDLEPADPDAKPRAHWPAVRKPKRRA